MDKLRLDNYIKMENTYQYKSKTPSMTEIVSENWPTDANEKQIGGTHYKQFKGYEPWDVITAWDLGYLDGTALKYIARWKHKNGIEDLQKAIHFLEKAIEVHEQKGLTGTTKTSG